MVLCPAPDTSQHRSHSNPCPEPLSLILSIAVLLQKTSTSAALFCSSAILLSSPDTPVPPQVKLAFSEERALPGSVLRLELEAAPRSLCAICAVDRSVLLLKPEAELSMEEVGGPTGVSPPCAAPWTSQDGGGDDINLVGILACPQLDVQPLGPGGGLVALGAGGRLAADPSWFCALYVVFIPRSTKCYPILTPLEAFETQSPVHLSGDIPAHPAPYP